MRLDAGRLLRDNAFLVAAVLLPVLVVGLFLVASAIPRWTVPAPSYDLVLRASGPYDPAGPRVGVEFNVRGDRVHATVRPLPANSYGQPAGLFLFDRATMEVRQVPFELPADLQEDDMSRTVAVDALAGRHVVPGATAPDGYVLEVRSGRGPGIVGEVFGMGAGRQRAVLVKEGRVVPIELPPPYNLRSHPPPSAVGWIVDEGSR